MSFYTDPLTKTAAAIVNSAPEQTTSQQRLSEAISKFEAFKAVPHSDLPEQKVLNRQIKIDRLHEAYALCLPLTSKEHPPEIIQASLTQITMILGEFGILHYGCEPSYAAIASPKDAKFTLSMQILQCALQAFLTRIGADTIKWDFNHTATADLKDLPNRIWQQNYFAPALDGFCQSNLEALLQKVKDIPFTKEQITYLSRMLRYLNGGARHIRYFKNLPKTERLKELSLLSASLKNEKSNEARGLQIDEEMKKIHAEIQQVEDADKKIILHTLYLAREISKANPAELWEVLYNDWEDAEKAEGKWTKENYLQKRLTLGQWLVDNAPSPSHKARATAKFFRSVGGMRDSLKECLGIIQKVMKAEDFQTLEAILQGKILEQTTIDSVAMKLSALDLSQQNLLTTVDWFVIVPNNLAVMLQEETNSNPKEIEGLLRFSVALIKPHLGKSGLHINHQAVLNNWDKFQAKLSQ